MKLVDVPDSKSGGPCARVGSTPTAGISHPAKKKFYYPKIFTRSILSELNNLELMLLSPLFFKTAFSKR